MPILGGNDTQLNILIKAKDQATKTLNNLQGRLQKMQPAFKKMSVAGTAAFGAISIAAGGAIKAFQAQESAEKKLATITKNTTNATDAQIKSLQKQAAELQKIGVVGDEVTMAGQAQLATFGLTTDAIAKLTPGLLDLAVNEKGVATTSEDLFNKANALGKVFTGQVGALSRMGITLTKSQEELLKTGTETEKVATLQKVLAQNVGGVNEAMRQTSAGGVKALKDSFGDLMESVGETLVPLLAQIVEKIQPVVERMMEWVEAHPTLTKAIILITAGLAALVAVVGALGLALPLIITGFGFLLGPVGAVALAIGGLIFIFRQLNEIWKLFETDSAAVWSGIKIMFKDSVNFLIGLAEGFANSWIKATNNIIEALNTIQVSIPDWVPGLGGKSFGINLPTVPEITLPRFEHGGRINAPRGIPVPIIAHGQEVITPANRGNTGNNQTFIVNINNPTVRSQDDIRQFKKQVEDSLRGVVRNRKLNTV